MIIGVDSPVETTCTAFVVTLGRECLWPTASVTPDRSVGREGARGTGWAPQHGGRTAYESITVVSHLRI